MAKGWLRLFNQFSINELYIHLRQSIIIRFLEDFDGNEANFGAFSFKTDRYKSVPCGITLNIGKNLCGAMLFL